MHHLRRRLEQDSRTSHTIRILHAHHLVEPSRRSRLIVHRLSHRVTPQKLIILAPLVSTITSSLRQTSTSRARRMIHRVHQEVPMIIMVKNSRILNLVRSRTSRSAFLDRVTERPEQLLVVQRDSFRRLQRGQISQPALRIVDRVGRELLRISLRERITVDCTLMVCMIRRLEDTSMRRLIPRERRKIPTSV